MENVFGFVAWTRICQNCFLFQLTFFLYYINDSSLWTQFIRRCRASSASFSCHFVFWPLRFPDHHSRRWVQFALVRSLSRSSLFHSQGRSISDKSVIAKRIKLIWTCQIKAFPLEYYRACHGRTSARCILRTALVRRAAWGAIVRSELADWGRSDGHILPAYFELGPEVVPRGAVRGALSCLKEQWKRKF